MNAVVQLPWLGSSILARAVPIVGSGVVHGALLVSLVVGAAAPHAPIAGPERVLTIEPLEDDAPAPKPLAPETEEPTPAPARAAAPSTHQHAYPVPSSHDATPHDPSLAHGEEHASLPAEEAPPVLVAPAPPPVFTIRVGPAIAPHGHAHGAGDHADGASAPAAPAAAIVAEAAVSVPARLVASAPASYPAEARANEVEAEVPLEIVVDTNGSVVDARPLTRAGLGFDEAAVAAIRRYRFSPAEQHGARVRVRMRWSVQFRLR